MLQKLHLLKIAGNLFNLLVVINCSVNFVLYSSFSSKFRVTFRRLFCHRVRRCRCLGADADELRWLRENDHSAGTGTGGGGIEMTCSRGDGVTEIARGRRARHSEMVVVVATPGGSRTYITRQRSHDRKQITATTTIEMTPTSQFGLTTTQTTSPTPGGSQSSVSDISEPLVTNKPAAAVPESS